MATIRQLSNLEQLAELELSKDCQVFPLEQPNRQDHPLVNLKRLQLSLRRGEAITKVTVDNFAQPILAWMANLKLFTGEIREADRDHMEPILKVLQDGGVRCQMKYW